MRIRLVEMLYDITQVDQESIIITDGTSVECNLTYIQLYELLSQYYNCISNPLGLIVRKKDKMPDGLDVVQYHNLDAVVKYCISKRQNSRRTDAIYSE